MTQFCPTCEDFCPVRTEDRQETFKVRGCDITVPVSVECCANCGEMLGSDEQDQRIIDQVHAEYRRQKGLLTPEEIKDIRERYQLSQRSFAALLGMSEASINRYERGGLQDESHDTVIRACREPSIVRDLLRRHGNRLSAWQRQRVEQALSDELQEYGNLIKFLGNNCFCMPEEVSKNTGFRRFDYTKFAAVVLWFCNRLGGVYITALNKLLFYSDFLHFKENTVSLTGAAYRRMQYGPVLADYEGLLGLMEGRNLIVKEEQYFPNGDTTGYRCKRGPSADSVAQDFSTSEIQVLERVAEALGQLKARQVSERSHQETAWLETPERELISYEFAKDLSMSIS